MVILPVQVDYVNLETHMQDMTRGDTYLAQVLGQSYGEDVRLSMVKSHAVSVLVGAHK